MNRNLIFGALLLVFGFCVGSGAQTQDQQPATGSESPKGQSGAPAAAVGGALLVPGGETSEAESYWTTRPTIPAIVGGYGSSLAFSTEMERSNFIRYGVTVQSTYNDNALLTNPAQSNATYSVFPQIALDQSRSRIRWVLNYAGGYTYNQNLSSQNQTSQNFNFDLQYRVSPHVNLRITEGVMLTTGLFSPVNTLNGSAPGVPQGGNEFVITPLSKEFTTDTRGDISYQFSATDVIGANAAYTSFNYRDVPPGTTLLDSKGQEAVGYYMHRISTSNWIGGSYRFHHLGYSPAIYDTVAQSVIAFDTWQVKRHMTISFFVGPQYSDNRYPVDVGATQLAYKTMWTVTGGASYSWQGPHTNVVLSYARRITDGGGVQGPVQLDSVSGSVRRQLSLRWTAAVNASYGANDSLTPSPQLTIPYSRLASAGVTVTRRFGEKCFLEFGYSRENQQTAGLSTLTGNANQNSVIASFSYQFVHPWGR
jgi:hypothetical protein